MIHCMKKLFTKRGIENGYIALISVIFITLILLGITFVLSSSGYYARESALDGEFKRISLGLAESCANVALLRIGQNFAYAPSAADQTVQVGTDTCVIQSVSYTAEDPVTREKTATVKTQGDYRGSFSNIVISATIQDPSFSSSIHPPPPNISVESWEERP